MKREFKTITAISTTINGHTEYISGQSVRDDNKYIPQFNQRTVHAKEFEDEADAQAYIGRIHNPHHRVFDIVTLQIPIIKDLKKYDRQVKRAAVHTIHGRTLPVRELLTIILIVLLTSCSKTQITAPHYTFDKYQMIIEHYTMDTTFINKFIWWQHDSVYKIEMKRMLDTIQPKWYLMCETDKMPLHLEYWYYTRNGIKIQNRN